MPTLFGIGVASDLIDTSHLPTTPTAASVVVLCAGPVSTVGLAAVHDQPDGRFACLTDGARLVLRRPGFVVGVGRDRAVVDGPRPREAIEACLVAVWAFVLDLHGRESFHGSVVARSGRAVAVLGLSGDGKSTIAARAVDAGWDLLSDDLVACAEDGSVAPGPGYLRLLGDEQADQPVDDAALGADGKRRAYAPVGPAAALGAVIVMDPAFPELTRLTGLAAADALLANRYIPFAVSPDQRRRSLAGAARIAGAVPVYGAPPRSLTVAHLDLALTGS